MTQHSDTKSRIIDRAADLLMQRGFNGFSYRDISTHLGVKNAAIHYHFPSKADLAMALVDEYRNVLHSRTADFMANGGSANEQLEGLFMFTRHQCSLGRSICPFGAFSVDYADLPEALREKTRVFMRESTAWLTKVLKTGLAQKEISFTGDAEAKALEILASLQGARQMDRIHDVNVLDQVIGSIRTQLGMAS